MKYIKTIAWILYVISSLVITMILFLSISLHEYLALTIIGAFWIGGGIGTYAITKRMITNSDFTGHGTSVDNANGVITLCSVDYPKYNGAVWRVTATNITVIDNKKTKVIPFVHIQQTEIHGNILVCAGLVARDVQRFVADNIFENERQTTLEILGQIEFPHEDKKIAETIYTRISKPDSNTNSFQFSFQSQHASYNNHG
jgi:hypothetical protein